MAAREVGWAQYVLLDHDIPAKPLRPRPARGFRILEIRLREKVCLCQRADPTEQVVEEPALRERFHHCHDLLLFRLLRDAVDA